MIRRLFVDIETSPNIVWSWATGYKMSIPCENIIKERRIICICASWEDSDTVYTFTWDDRQNDRRALRLFMTLLARADEVVAHNGDRFDIPWIRSRCAIHDIAMRPNIPTSDTLKYARGAFKFNSNKLGYLAKVLGLAPKGEPSITLWTRATLDNDREAVGELAEYCRNDVLVLKQLYKKLAQYVVPKVHHAVLDGGTKVDCPRCRGTNVRLDNTRATAKGSIMRQLICKDCKTYFTVSDAVYRKLLT